MEDNGFLDLSDHDSFANGVPHKTFERIRNEDPVFWTKEKNGRGFWSITKHADIIHASERFSIQSLVVRICLRNTLHLSTANF